MGLKAHRSVEMLQYWVISNVSASGCLICLRRVFTCSHFEGSHTSKAFPSSAEEFFEFDAYGLRRYQYQSFHPHGAGNLQSK